MQSSRQSRAGWAGIAAAVLGVASAVVMLAWTPDVAPGVVRYPFSPQSFRIIQTWFFIHHWLLVAVAWGFARSPALGVRQAGRVGAWMAVVGLVGLACMELVAIGFAELNAKDANEGAMGVGYGVATNLVGLGMLLAGWGVWRQRRWTGWRATVPFLIGATHFAVVTPALFSGHYVLARLAIATWIAMFGALGWALVRDHDSSAAPSV